MINKNDIYNAILFLFLGIIVGALICIFYTPSLSLFVRDSYSFNNNVVVNNDNIHLASPNPSATYCIEDINGEYNIRVTKTGLEYGVCILSNLKEVNAWDLFYVDHKICPEMCVPMWMLVNNTCGYIDCGSGCGPNNITTFETFEDCNSNILVIDYK